MLSHYDYDPTHNATAILCALGIDIIRRVTSHVG